MKYGWLLVALLILITSGTQQAVGQVSMPVTWTGLINATATGNSVQNTGGPGSGAVSAQHLTSGDGYVEVTVTDPTMDYVVSVGYFGAGAPFVSGRALHLCMYGAEVREGDWALQANTLATKDDVFRIAIVGGQVQYSKNGTVFFISSRPFPPGQYPAAVFVSFWSFGAKLSNANLSATGWALATPGTPRLRAVNPPGLQR